MTLIACGLLLGIAGLLAAMIHAFLSRDDRTPDVGWIRFGESVHRQAAKSSRAAGMDHPTSCSR